jgi:hypothetical protein
VEIRVCTCLYLGVAFSFPPRLLRRRCPREAAKYKYSRSVLRSFPLFTNLCRSECYELDMFTLYKDASSRRIYRRHEVLYHSLFTDVYIVTMSIRRSSHKLSQIDEHQLQGGDQCPGFVLAGDFEVFLVSKTLALTFFLAYVAGLLA